ncbi:hypothetical protein OC842_006332 [Tilletia horrida]|uniref:Uncharacterized protein n=1 Tax=Tilletia horrida TaxID=155126 RepID=A0AAN6G625_9BASI|nr:hypothetical protein OC842_006332 [Tilletia horrida]
MSRRPQSRISAFFGSLGRSSTAPPPPPPDNAEDAQHATSTYGSTDDDAGAEGSAAPAAATAPQPSLTSRSRTFFKRKRPDPTKQWLQSRRPPYRRKRVRVLFALGVLLLLLSLASSLLLLLNLFAPIPALVPASNTPGTASLWFALSAALIVAPSLLVFELSSKATHAVHSTSTAILALALLLLVSIAPLRQAETVLCAPMIALALIACGWALLSSSVVGQLQVAYALKAPPGIFIPTGEHPQPPAAAQSGEQGGAAPPAHLCAAVTDIEASDENTPLLAAYTTSVQHAQRGWRRVVKLALAVLGTLTISLLIGLQSFNLLLTGTDAGLHPVGDRVLIDPSAALHSQIQHLHPSHSRLRLGAAGDTPDADKNDTTIEIPPLPLPKWFLAVPPFKLHVACESSPPHTGHQGQGSKPSRPTALFFAERGVAGEVGASWVRDMVRRAAEGDEYGNGHFGGENSTDDGHLSLEKVCFFDRVGYGHSDFVGGEEGPASVRLNTLALYSALGTLGVLNGSYPVDPDRPANETNGLSPIISAAHSSGATSAWWWPWRGRKSKQPREKPSKAPNPNPSPPPSGGHGGHGNHSANGTSPPFMLIAQGYGALHARHFAATFPTLVHSVLLIDAETPTSFYTDTVSASSGLRAGFAAWGHAWGLHTLGFLAWDVAPALLEPLGVVRLAGMVLLGRGARDRVLAPRGRGGARWATRDAGGGGWRLWAAGGANARLLSTSLAERLDANRGSGSRNRAELMAPALADLLRKEVAQRPTAILSSFWKVHADLPGWADIQRAELVKDAREAGGLVGWWRLGSPLRAGKGGDGGEAEGICAEPMGRIYCEEAVRKLLAQGDLDERHRREGKEKEKEKETGAGQAVLDRRPPVVAEYEEDDFDPRKPWPPNQLTLAP